MAVVKSEGNFKRWLT